MESTAPRGDSSDDLLYSNAGELHSTNIPNQFQNMMSPMDHMMRMSPRIESDLMITRKLKGQEYLPQGVRTIIFSYLDLLTLINKISQLSKKDREMLQTSGNLTQRRCLALTVDDSIRIKPSQLTFCVKLASEFELRIFSLKEQNYIYIVETLLEKIIGTGKPLSLVLHISETVKFEYIHSIFAASMLRFKSIEYKMMTSDGNVQRYLQSYFQSLDKTSDIVLDGNQHFFRIDFGIFPQLVNCRSLVCIINNDNFKSSLQAFPRLRKLYWKVAQLKFYNNSFENVPDLEELKIEIIISNNNTARTGVA